LSSFRFIIKQQWTIEEISIFSNNSHLELYLSDTILKGTHTRTIPARFGLIWFRGFRGEDLNVKVYDVRRTPSDGKSSYGLWPGEITGDGKSSHGHWLGELKTLLYLNKNKLHTCTQFERAITSTTNSAILWLKGEYFCQKII
jgi:hypothetical protein